MLHSIFKNLEKQNKIVNFAAVILKTIFLP